MYSTEKVASVRPRNFPILGALLFSSTIQGGGKRREGMGIVSAKGRRGQLTKSGAEIDFAAGTLFAVPDSPNQERTHALETCRSFFQHVAFG